VPVPALAPEPLSVERARELWAEGHRRAPLDGMIARVRAEPSDRGARLALVGFYRDLGAPDQAGRWGAALEGEPTDRELDRLARLLVASGVDRAHAARFLVLGKGRMPQRIDALFDVEVPRYRERLTRVEVRSSRESSPADISGVAWLFTICATPVLATVVWVLVAVDVPDAPLLARAAGSLLGTLLGVCLLLSGLAPALERRSTSLGWFAAGLGLLAVALVPPLLGLTPPWEQ